MVMSNDILRGALIDPEEEEEEEGVCVCMCVCTVVMAHCWSSAWRQQPASMIFFFF